MDLLITDGCLHVNTIKPFTLDMSSYYNIIEKLM
jgi:hypothetical protein